MQEDSNGGWFRNDLIPALQFFFLVVNTWLLLSMIEPTLRDRTMFVSGAIVGSVLTVTLLVGFRRATDRLPTAAAKPSQEQQAVESLLDVLARRMQGTRPSGQQAQPPAQAPTGSMYASYGKPAATPRRTRPPSRERGLALLDDYEGFDDFDDFDDYDAKRDLSY
ncbi:MAG: hypothetical protein Kow0077_32260 [Anaerolineae bacterium]